MKNRYTLALAAVVLIPLTVATPAQAGPTICIPANSKAVFSVRFSAAWENGIKLINKNNGRAIRTGGDAQHLPVRPESELAGQVSGVRPGRNRADRGGHRQTSEKEAPGLTVTGPGPNA